MIKSLGIKCNIFEKYLKVQTEFGCKEINLYYVKVNKSQNIITD